MNNFLKTYEFTITTKGPVHIGDGKTLSKVDYFFYKDRIYFPDFHKLYQYIKQMHLVRDYENFIFSAQNNLTNWLKQKKIISTVAERCTDYSISLAGSTVSRPRNLNTFIKDPYGNPYIPGSSLKGLLRTLLLVKEIVEHPDKFAQVKRNIRQVTRRGDGSRNSLLNKETSLLEELAFHQLKNTDNSRDAVNDMFKGLIVSDSKPISKNDLIVTEKIDYNIKGIEKTIPLVRESLAPNTQVKFCVTVDPSIFPYTVGDILQAVKLFADDYYTYFSSNFRGMRKPTANTVWLGGGAGYVTKTIIYNLFGEDAYNEVSSILNITTIKQHMHNMDTKKGVSPVAEKLTRCNNTLHHFGECTLSITEI